MLVNGRYCPSADIFHLLDQMDSVADVISLDLLPANAPVREKVLLTSEGDLAGFRRIYQNSVMEAAPPRHWPAVLLVRSAAASRLFPAGIPLNLREIFASARALGFSIRCLEGICQFDDLAGNLGFYRQARAAESLAAASNPSGESNYRDEPLPPPALAGRYYLQQARIESADQNYRNWPAFSYARFWKRLADFLLALIVLILFLPVFPFLALAIKLNSAGPVFFGHWRQGLHGREFRCWKFRTMIPGADDIQAILRSLNQVDGPQFHLKDDPRVSAVGRFLRDTSLDEIPQFINVLLGQMSVVGPRPSPEVENSLCPWWRDARLSVRPGITGLWQVSRTRLPGQDFQEWIQYDTRYVNNLALWFDLRICGRTALKLIHDFLKQF